MFGCFGARVFPVRANNDDGARCLCVALCAPDKWGPPFSIYRGDERQKVSRHEQAGDGSFRREGIFPQLDPHAA